MIAYSAAVHFGMFPGTAISPAGVLIFKSRIALQTQGRVTGSVTSRTPTSTVRAVFAWAPAWLELVAGLRV